MANKVVFIDETAELGGAEINLIQITSALTQRGVDVLVILPSFGPLVTRLESNGIKVKIITGCPLNSVSFYIGKSIKFPNPFALFLNLMMGLRWALRLSKELKNCSHPITQTNSINSHLFGGLAGKISGSKVIWHFQDIIFEKSGFGLFKLLITIFARFIPDRILCISRDVAKPFETNKVNSKKVTLLLNSIDLAPYDNKSSKAFPKSGNTINIGTVSRLTPWKGQLSALKVAHNLKELQINFHWYFAGASTLGITEFQQYLNQKVSDWGLESHVTFLGWVEDMPSFYRSLDCLVHLPTEPEPFGLVIIEAMAAGVPAISTPGGAADEHIIAGGGWMVKVGDDLSVTAIIKNAVENPSDLRNRSEQAHNYANKTFNFDLYISNLLSQYSLLSENEKSC